MVLETLPCRGAKPRSPGPSGESARLCRAQPTLEGTIAPHIGDIPRAAPSTPRCLKAARRPGASGRAREPGGMPSFSVILQPGWAGRGWQRVRMQRGSRSPPAPLPGPPADPRAAPAAGPTCGAVERREAETCRNEEGGQGQSTNICLLGQFSASSAASAGAAREQAGIGGQGQGGGHKHLLVFWFVVFFHTHKFCFF